MKTSSLPLSLRTLLLAASSAALCQCSSTSSRDVATTTTPAATATTRSSPSEASKTTTKTEVASNAEDDEYAATEISDPFEKLNRGTFWLNEKVYVVARPISKGYEKVMPKPFRRGIDNAFVNLRYPVRFVNCALQGKFKRAGQETGKFLVNTVGGIGGLFKVSDKIDSLADIPLEDTGQTFGVWGIGQGAYLVLPIVGPSSIRDGVGRAGDWVLNPINWGIFWSGDHDWTMIPSAVDNLNYMPTAFAYYDSVTKDAVDPYVSLRNAWAQYRNEEVKK